MTKDTVCRAKEFAVSWNAILPTDFRLRRVIDLHFGAILRKYVWNDELGVNRPDAGRTAATSTRRLATSGKRSTRGTAIFKGQTEEQEPRGGD